MSRRITVVGAAAGAVLLLAVPGSASAITASLNRPCYSHIPTKGSEPMVVSLAGGTPGANFIVAATVPGKGTGSAGSTEGTFDAAGNGTAQITDVSPPSGTVNPTRGQRIALSVQDFGAGGAEIPVGTALVTTLAMQVSSKPTNPRKARRVRVSGTPFASRRLYGFIVRGSSRHVLRRISLGRTNVCGYTSKRAIVAPKAFRYGRYLLYVNAGKKLNRHRSIHISFRIYRRHF